MASLPPPRMGGKIREFTDLVKIRIDDMYALGSGAMIALDMHGTVVLTATGVRLSRTLRVRTRPSSLANSPHGQNIGWLAAEKPSRTTNSSFVSIS
jgi:hypothetical protein